MASRDPAPTRRANSPALDALGAEERATVMLRSSPGLAVDAKRVARDLFEKTSAEAVAEAVPEWTDRLADPGRRR